MKIAGVFVLLSLALLCIFSGVFGQGGQDKRGWITRSEGRLPGKGVLRRRLFQEDSMVCLLKSCLRPLPCRTSIQRCAFYTLINCGEFRDPKVFCTRESDPLCGSDGQTYGNKCAFCKALAKSSGKINLKHHGKC